MIWGENHGLCEYLSGAFRVIDGLQKYSGRQNREYRRRGNLAWMPVMNPPAEAFEEGVRLLLEAYFRDPAIERFGKYRWGFKEVRHGLSTAVFLLRLYPTARFVLLGRDPLDCLASARATGALGLRRGILDEVGGSRAFLEHWARLTDDFLGAGWAAVPHRRLRYENLLRDPARVLAGLAEFLGEDAGAFDLGVMDVRRRGGFGLPPRRKREDLALVRDLVGERLRERFGAF